MVKRELSIRVLSLLCVSVLPSVTPAVAQVTPIVNLSQGTEYRINTADDNSLKTRTDIFFFQNTKAQEVASIIQQSLSKYGKLSLNSSNNSIIITDEEIKLSNILDLCKKLDVQSMTDFQSVHVEKIPMKYNRASEIVRIVRPLMSIEGAIAADDDFNAIFVTDHLPSIQKIKAAVELHDVPKKQVVIDLQIIEVEKNALAENGIDWDKLLSSTWLSINPQFSYLASSSKIEKHIAGTFKEASVNSNAGSNVKDVSEMIRFMQEKGHAKILATPKIVTMTGQFARIWFGKDVRYPSMESENQRYSTRNNSFDAANEHLIHLSDTSETSQGYYGSLSNDNSYSYNGYRYTDPGQDKTAGLDLSITPYIGEGDLIEMKLACKLSDITDWTKNNIPVVTGQDLNCNVLCKENKTILLGGLKHTKSIVTRKRIPILGTVLPFLFSKKINSEVETEIAIMLTPRIFDVSKVESADSQMDTTKDHNHKTVQIQKK